MWMVILQSEAGVIVRDEWPGMKPNKSHIDYLEEYHSNKCGETMVVVNMYYVEE